MVSEKEWVRAETVIGVVSVLTKSFFSPAIALATLGVANRNRGEVRRLPLLSL